MENKLEFVEIFAGELWQAEMIKEMLEDNGIQAYLDNELMGNIAPWIVTPGGTASVKINISTSDYVRSKELIDELNSGNNSPLDDDED
ncbi:MAG: DUF2007 domain-containing protein [Bacteroidota bacterium]|nr:DUF2007 domain-containing protein [Bacteroidota bacterium]